MRAVVQRVQSATIKVASETVGAIGPGLLVLLAVGKSDTTKDADFLLNKILHLRVFDDAEGKMNRSVDDVQGELLIVSQFTLYGDCRRGHRPSYSAAADREKALALYEYFVAAARTRDRRVQTGIFQAHMEVQLINDGPVTILLDSQLLF
ncbi:MAG: D-tyrosyl-tRNA(Tyr) deacylase [Acidobacteria bacterium]|nr:D-tyrosyl-tRNA(Tyr) deacylase [Acidobacteriota bacterium]MBI3655678.1 D-tyrosyl-tRNA(Tyr) deacylase [Acidobacteriota bacterium]